MSRAPAARAVVAAALLCLAPVAACRPAGPADIARAAAHAGGGGEDASLDMVIEDPHGRTMRLADYAGKVRVIDVWATWCAPCREVIPQLNALYERYRDRGLVVVGVSVDSDPAEVLDFMREIPIRYPSGMFNPDLAPLIGEPSAIPTTFLIDRLGVIRETFVGFVDSATLEARVRQLL
jgi:cytochrome c biogenesis protein CcmG/thiol:disulfide interchange protein DsbE